MSEFSSFERRVALMLDKYPFVKRSIKTCYSYLMRIVQIKGERAQFMYSINAVHSHEESFFGYYDKFPSNGKGLVLFHSSSFDTSQQADKVPYISIVLQDEVSKVILWRHETKAFNWQQGSRLQWITEDKFIFNVFDEHAKAYRAKVVSTIDYTFSDYEFPVQDSFGEQYYLSLNYNRLATLKPEYGYHCVQALSYDLLPDYEDDGIWKVDCCKGKGSLILSLSEICQFCPEEQFHNSTHLVNHIQISPTGESFVFLHRYTFKGKQTDRLILFNFMTGQLKLIAASNLVSHFYWQSNNALVVYLEDPSKGRCYVHINLETLQRRYLTCLDGYGDGHPGGIGSVMITDTYPNRSGHQSLLMLKNVLENQNPMELAKLYHPLKFMGGSRCDLHPRIDEETKVIYFDSVYTGKRQLYRMELTDD